MRGPTDILSRDEITRLLARNLASPDLGRQVTVLCYDDKVPGAPDRAPARKGEAHASWLRRLHSKVWRVQRRGFDTNKCRTATRAVRTQAGWQEYPLNQKVRA